MDRGAPELLKKLFSLFQVKDVTPLRLSQQYAAQELQPDKVFYVLGGWRCRFFFRVAATIFALQEDWLSVEIRICPASMLTHVSQVHAPLIFTSTCPTTEAWLPRFLAIAVDATKRSRGLLGYFTFDELNSIEDIISDIEEPDPWPSTIDFLWSYLLTAVDEEWMSFGNKLSDPKEPAPEDSAPEVTPPLTLTTQSALAEKLHHRESCACLASPLTSLPDEAEDLGSFSILSISCLPQWSHSKWWSSFLRRISHDISPGRVKAR